MHLELCFGLSASWPDSFSFRLRLEVPFLQLLLKLPLQLLFKLLLEPIPSVAASVAASYIPSSFRAPCPTLITHRSPLHFVVHSKFALIVTETGDDVTAYGFQFKKKEQANPFLLALETATKIVPEQGVKVGGKRGNKTLIMAQRSSNVLVCMLHREVSRFYLRPGNGRRKGHSFIFCWFLADRLAAGACRAHPAKKRRQRERCPPSSDRR